MEGFAYLRLNMKIYGGVSAKIITNTNNKGLGMEIEEIVPQIIKKHPERFEQIGNLFCYNPPEQTLETPWHLGGFRLPNLVRLVGLPPSKPWLLGGAAPWTLAVY